MTDFKLVGTPSSAVSTVLEPHVPRWYRDLGGHHLLIAELRMVERSEVVPDGTAKAAVKAQLVSCEVPDAEQEVLLRGVMRALYTVRTATGTLTEDLDLALARQTLRNCKGDLLTAGAARLSAGLHHWLGYVKRVQQNPTLTVGELRHELDAVAKGLTDLAHGGSGQLAIDLEDQGDDDQDDDR